MLPRPRYLLSICIFAVTLTALIATGCARLGDPAIDLADLLPAEEAAPEAPPAPPTGPVVGLLDGVFLSDEEAAELEGRVPVAVMIDNLPGQSRPQIGLDRADLVYEFLVEGGITRFMAVYLRQEADWIEPVRSVRTPSAILAKELGALVGYVGAAEMDGAADAARQIAEWGVPAIDGDADRTPFWRDPRRRAPHNMVTSTRALRTRAGEFGWPSPEPAASWRFQEDHSEGPSNGPARALSYGFALRTPALPAFNAAWSYDPAANAYVRSMAGRLHTDGRTSAPLTAKNVVVEFHRASVVDRDGHVVYDQVGEGAAWVFRDGQVIEAVWAKRSTEDRTRYWATNGEEIALNRGRTWVALVPTGSPFSWR
ncbi:MAG: DUF3048 domain-containing protein [Dehalococcoidia bacterium]